MLICLASAKGSPGVTSVALALSAAWPRPMVLVEADPAGGDLRYRCRAADGGAPHESTGLVRLAATVRRGVPGPDVVAEHAQAMACGVHLVPGFTTPGQSRGMGELWSMLVRACQEAALDVVVDLGRLDPSSAVLPLAQAADILLPVASASLESVVHTSAAITELLPALTRTRPLSVVPILVGPDAYARSDCSDLDELLTRAGCPVEATQPVARDPKALSRLEGGERADGRLGRTLLMRSARALAHAITGVPMAPSDPRASGELATAEHRDPAVGYTPTTSEPSR